MTNLTEASTFDAGVYQLETSDPVQGGPSGKSNAPLINLANRTRWLYDQLALLVTSNGGKAPINSPTFTGTAAAPTPTSGDDTTKIATTAFVQNAAGGVVDVTVAGGSNVTLTAAQWGCGVIVLYGALTADINLIFPTRRDLWTVINSSTGAYSITCKTAAGTGVVITQTKGRSIFCDGTNILSCVTDLQDAALTGNPTAPTPATADNDTSIATTAMVQAAIAAGIAAAVTVPSGSVSAYAGATVPAGWLECAGQAVSRATYAALFTAVGTVHGVGDGSTTFNLPDLRGEFVRGWDNGRGIDASRDLGSSQAQSIEAHTHSLPVRTNANTGTYLEDADSSSGSQSVNTGSYGGAETRPRNVALMYIIKT